MTESTSNLAEKPLDELARRWWQTAIPRANDPDAWDGEIRAINAMAETFGNLPDWALQARDAMPRYGFEMCAHRWLDGLDDAIRTLGTETFHPSQAGRCGDVPGCIVARAEQRASAVKAWLDGRAPMGNGLQALVASWLGEPTTEKSEAAACFVELVRRHRLATTERSELVKPWLVRAEANPVLGQVLGKPGLLDDLLDNACGFKLVDRLDAYVRIIGGDPAMLPEVRYNCNSQLRFVFRDALERYETTRGYLWGLYAYLTDRDETWLREAQPACAGAAVYALQGVSRAGSPTPLRRWLGASLLKASKVWCQCALERTGDTDLPQGVRDLPDVVAALTA